MTSADFLNEMERLATPSYNYSRTASLLALTSYDIELHSFVDASEYGVRICRFRIGKADDITDLLIAAKSKVAPLKPLSIPRMELLAAVIGALCPTKCGALAT